MATDRELLELAAKAAGITLEWNDHGESGYWTTWRDLPQWVEWNPFDDDVDAKCVAQKLGIEVVQYFEYVPPHVFARCMLANGICGTWAEPHLNDPAKATRRAIVSAAARLGRQNLMKQGAS